MEATIYIEIPIDVTFSVDPGQKGSWDEPGYPATIDDIDFKEVQVIEAVNNAIFGKKSTIDEDLMEEALTARKNEAEYYGEMAYEAYKETLEDPLF